ncbi:MAG: hypothetical protein KJ597_05220 [Nanoarchaeota archaeon]|nr:hypothetical protein [Nanoarchaeota archaeon]
MKKSIFVVLSLLVIAMFLVGCVPQEELSQEDQQALDSELNEMSDEQLDQVIEDVESEGAIALAGQAYSKYKAIPKASRSRFLASAYKAKLARVKSKTTLQYALQDATIYEADVKLGGEVYPFSFNQGEQILTFKYWGTGETISIATTKSMGQYVGTFKVGGGSYPVSIDWGLQPPIMTLEGWPGTS